MVPSVPSVPLGSQREKTVPSVPLKITLADRPVDGHKD